MTQDQSAHIHLFRENWIKTLSWSTFQILSQSCSPLPLKDDLNTDALKRENVAYKHTGDAIHMTCVAPDSCKYNYESRRNVSKRPVMFPRAFWSAGAAGTQFRVIALSLPLWAGPDRYQRSFLLHSYPDTADPSFSLTKLIILSCGAGRQEP